MAGALDGVRVIDFSHALNGPFCTMVLGYLGAEVIKVEPLGGDRFRRSWMPASSRQDSYEFLMANTNKKSVVINLKSDRGRKLARQLITISDVLVENYAAGTMERLGLDYNSVKPLNPRLIYACSRGFGDSGPYAKYGANASVNNAMTGWTDTAWRHSGSAGTKALGIGDEAGGISMAVGILAALYARERTGEGQKVEVSMQEALLGFMVSSLHEYFTGNKVGETPVNVADGFYALRVPELTDDVWTCLVRAMDRPDLLDDPRFRTAELRRNHKKEARQTISDWASRKTRQELWETLRDIGYFGAPILSIGEVLKDPHVQARGAFTQMKHPAAGLITLLEPWIRLSSTGSSIRHVSPLVGEHTDEILSRLLGLSHAELGDLHALGVIG